jgi:hypothetical protein
LQRIWKELLDVSYHVDWLASRYYVLLCWSQINDGI